MAQLKACKQYALTFSISRPTEESHGREGMHSLEVYC